MIPGRFPFFCARCGHEMNWADETKERSVHVVNGGGRCPGRARCVKCGKFMVHGHTRRLCRRGQFCLEAPANDDA